MEDTECEITQRHIREKVIEFQIKVDALFLAGMPRCFSYIFLAMLNAYFFDMIYVLGNFTSSVARSHSPKRQYAMQIVGAVRIRSDDVQLGKRWLS